ncbi:homoserine O-acetyltransferase MetX [Bacillus canaveralius]|uniref:homoserine O-acetyltransferase MetX n=1 Tax=Bacillus canaveralius TaxID=1403243 RepID=UPI001FE42926|nr:homoserine O-acetyltransferase [Bacillus canaveralius]
MKRSINGKKPGALLIEYGKVNIGSFTFDSGDQLEEVELAYELAGKRNRPVVIVCHALTGNQNTVGTNDQPGWWSGLIGPGRYIDTNEYMVITFNVLGGCSGSTGPASINPKTGSTYKQDFPEITIRDIVRAQHQALQKLGIHEAKAIIGGSLGGMQAWEWGILYPSFSELLIPLAATPFLSDYAIAFNTIGRTAIMADPEWQGGYYPDGKKLAGLEIARMVGMVTYRTDYLFSNRFQREQKVDGAEFQVESYLKYQGEKLAARFDANSYLRLLSAMDRHDIGFNRKNWQEALKQVQASVLLLGFTGDLLYPPHAIKEAADLLLEQNKESVFFEVKTNFGHDGFLTEFSNWSGHIKTALDSGLRGVDKCKPLTLYY